ncbi:hypothetical protein QL285_008858 [Trifolium repens]|nr:hypothetical protein QL285_008858 [Trifolium repens]
MHNYTATHQSTHTKTDTVHSHNTYQKHIPETRAGNQTNKLIITFTPPFGHKFDKYTPSESTEVQDSPAPPHYQHAEKNRFSHIRSTYKNSNNHHQLPQELLIPSLLNLMHIGQTGYMQPHHNYKCTWGRQAMCNHHNIRMLL